MKIEEKVKTKFAELIKKGDFFTSSLDEFNRLEEKSLCDDYKGWMVSAKNLVCLVVADGADHNTYRQAVSEYCSDSSFDVHSGEITSILRYLLEDIKAGLVSSIQDQTKAIIFDELLDHAKYLLNKKRKDTAGVIAGVAFEDTLRNICRKNGIQEKDVNDKYINVDRLITELQNNISDFSSNKAKRARAAAGVRTSATHADWEAFESSDVKSTIEVTEELIKSYLE